MLCLYDQSSFIYTTGICIRSVRQLGIDIYRYAIGFAGSIMIVLIVYSTYSYFNKLFPRVANILTYLGRITLTVYITDSLLNVYILPKLTSTLYLNYIFTIIETIVITILCLLIDLAIKKVPIGRKILLGSR